MDSTKDYLKKPIVDMIEGKYLLFWEKELDRARQKYHEAEQLAFLIEDKKLSQKIEEEWLRDFELYMTWMSCMNDFFLIIF